MKNKKTKIFNSPVLGLIFAGLSNALVIAVIVILNRYSSVNSRYYLIGILIAVLMILIVNVFFLMGYVKRKKNFRILFVVFSITLSLILSVGTWYIYRGSTSIDKIINDRGVEDLEYSLITLDQSMTLQFLSDEKIAIVKDDYSELESEVKGTLSDYSESLEYVDYDTYRYLLMAAQETEHNLMVVPSDFRKLLEHPEDEKIFENAKTLLTFNTQQQEDVSNVDVLKDPFTVLMLGNNDGLSDSIILASFNPQTLKATMTSLARDSYVPIACYPYGIRDKLNHSRAHSRQCIIDTVENFLDVEVDFYFETDFYALVKMVDTLGGLEIESPVSFSGSLPVEEEISKYESIHIRKGKHLIDGKQAITFARERLHMPNGDFDRQLNQQYVIRELANKIFATRNIETFMDILDVAQDNIVMNIPVRSLSSLLGYSLDQINLSPVNGLDAFRIVQTQIAGTTPTIEGLSVVMPYLEDIETSSRLISENISTDYEKKNITHFDFSYTNPYELDLSDPNMAGASDATLGGNTLFTVPDFSGWAISEIKNWGSNRGIHMVVEEVEGSESGRLMSQNPNSGTYSQEPQEIYIKYMVKEEKPEPEIIMQEISIPDLIGEDRSAIQSWVTNAQEEFGEDVITYQIEEVESTEYEVDEIVDQSRVGIQSFETSIEVIFKVSKEKIEDDSEDDSEEDLEEDERESAEEETDESTE